MITKTSNIEQQEKDKLCAKAMQSNNPAKAKIAFNQLHKRYKDPLFFFTMRYVKMNKETTDDLVQEIFVKIWEKIEKYDFSNALSTWMYKVATNHIIDYKRRQKVEVLNFDSLKILGDDGSEEDSMSFQIEDKSTDTFILVVKKERALAILDALKNGVKSEDAKQIIALIFLDDMSYEKVSEQTRLPLGTVKALMFRAKSEMKKYLSVESRDFSYGRVVKKKTKIKESAEVEVEEELEEELEGAE